MKRRLTTLAMIVAGMVGITARLHGDEAPPAPEPPPSTEQIRQWVIALGSDRFETRETATRRLEQAGLGAVGPLSEVAQRDSLEATGRAIRGLQGIAERGDRPTFEAAETVLEQLMTSKNRSAARRAAEALYELSGPRSRHALARIVELGGIVKDMPKVQPNEAVRGSVQIIIDRRWKGGDEGLLHLRRIAELNAPYVYVYVYVIRGATVSQPALNKLEGDLPSLRIQHRGSAMLGISAGPSTEGSGCEVSIVTPGSAADDAGLKPRDVIVKYDDEPIRDFDRLIEITREHNSGDKIVLDVLRGGRLIRKEVVLGEWQ